MAVVSITVLSLIGKRQPSSSGNICRINDDDEEYVSLLDHYLVFLRLGKRCIFRSDRQILD